MIRLPIKIILIVLLIWFYLIVRIEFFVISSICYLWNIKISLKFGRENNSAFYQILIILFNLIISIKEFLKLFVMRTRIKKHSLLFR